VLRKDGASAIGSYLDELFSSSVENQERIRRYYALARAYELEHAAVMARGRARRNHTSAWNNASPRRRNS